MAVAYKNLGQSAPAATTDTLLYTVPASTEAVVKVFVCNRGAIGSFRVAVLPGGGSVANADYLVYDMPLDANASFELSGIAMAATDTLRVYASTANFSFNAYGTEKS
jgi:hypothetical protein